MRISEQTAEAIMNGELDLGDIINGDSDVPITDFDALQEMFQEIADDGDFDMDADFLDILDVMFDVIEMDFIEHNDMAKS